MSFPRLLSDPKLKKILLNPIIASPCGHTSEGDVIENCDNCPTCNEPIASTAPNLILKEIIETYLQTHPNEKSNQYLSPEFFIELIEKNEIDKLLKLLKKYPEKIDLELSPGKGFFHHAIDVRNINLIERLSADFPEKIDQRYGGTSPLLHAGIRLNQYCEGNSRIQLRDIFIKLIEAGADPGLVNNKNDDFYYHDSPLRRAILHCRDYQDVTPLAALLKSGKFLNPNCAPSKTSMPLIVALNTPESDLPLDLFKKLLSTEGIDFNHFDRIFGTPLTLAAKSGSVERVKVLLSMPNIDANSTWSDEHTKTFFPLKEAIERGYTKIAALLSGFMLVTDLLANDHGKTEAIFQYLKSLNDEDFEFLFECAKNQGYEEAKIKPAINFIKDLINSDHSQSNFFSQKDSHAATNMLDRFFLFAPNKEWQTNIRKEAVKQFNDNLKGLDDETQKVELNWGSEQTIFKRHKDKIHFWGPTSTVKEFHNKLHRLSLKDKISESKQEESPSLLKRSNRRH